ncbi:uncharacterized protein LOC5564893 [Aedes aegypti]|uniref:C2H2-type domain-containing protein n=1 Tax=Aedes aegypti TaxID=7159 RepID=A0A6I8U6S0_AEDAE|nr:uncharacterized protein LOC5564893 [Aedes aegypti]
MDCEFMSSDFKRITKHVVKHISEGHPVFCPLKCRTGKPFATPNSLRIHNMYFHRIGVPRNLSRPDVSQPKYGSTDQVCAPHPEVTVCNTDVEVVGKADQEEKTEIEQRVELNSNFEMVIGSLLLKLLSKNHVTDVVIQEIVDAMDEALTIEKQFLNFKCKSFASENSLSAEVTGKLINSMCSDNLQSNLFGPKGKFRSSYTRKKFFRENFAYVSPVQILLQRDGDHNSCFYYYVPILQTLTSMLNDEKIYDAIFREKLSVPHHMTDYTDGLKYKNSGFFGRKTLNLFFYQDAAEVVLNAVGNATGRHKLECWYMVVGNLDPHLRCLTDNIQLVLLCKTKDFAYFGTDAILRRLVEDLKTLENSGIIVNGGGYEERIYGSIFITMNDNLGAHQLAGLTENFSRSSYFCRFCYVQHQSFKENCFMLAEPRTSQSSSQDIQIINCNPSEIPYRGVKAPCILNELTYFNMFHYGSAPCIAHDLFEGWVNSDLFLIFKKLVKSKSISTNYLQAKINAIFKQLKIKTKIALDFSRKSKTIKAKACDIWHIVQIIPFLFIKTTVDYNIPEMLMLLLIKQITDIITSPVISKDHVQLLAVLIREYLEFRSENFEAPLKPKHHFTMHYPHLILWLGPLMSYCTLFCERKHCFFKRALRSTLNFKNVVKFCAEHHQYYQGLLNTKTNRFEKQFVAEKYLESSAFLPCSTTDLLGKSGLLHDQNLYAEEAVYCGHDYKKGQFLFLSHDEYGEVFFVLKIQLLIFEPKTNNLYIFGEKKAVTNIHEKGLLVVQREVLDTEVKNIETFIDRTPLETYIESSKEYLFIKHTIPLIN